MHFGIDGKLVVLTDDIDVELTVAEAEQLPPVEISKGKKFSNRLSGAIKSLKGMRSLLTWAKTFTSS